MSQLLKVVTYVLFLLALGNYCFSQRRIIVVPSGQPVPVGRLRPYYRMNQPPNPGRRIVMVKENFISKRLNLTEEQSQQFWPIYRKYQQELMIVRIKKHMNSTSTSTDPTVQINNELAFDQELVGIRQHYKDEFLKILPPDKVSTLYQSEREFNDEALKILGERGVRPVK
jgi:hypothetical protein